MRESAGLFFMKNYQFRSFFSTQKTFDQAQLLKSLEKEKSLLITQIFLAFTFSVLCHSPER